MGTHAAMRKSEMALPSKTLNSTNEDATRKLRIFPKKFTANCVPKAFNIIATSNSTSTEETQKYLDKESLKGLYLAGTQVTGELSRLNVLLKGALDIAKVMSEISCLNGGALSVLSPAMGQGAVSRLLAATRRLAQCHLASLLAAS